MPDKGRRTRPGELYEIDPHTRAKLDILRYYLAAYFSILGSNAAARRLLYVDGFAGPDEYLNLDYGSPTVALQAASTAAEASHWKAGGVDCVFVERVKWIHDHMAQHIRRLDLHPQVRAVTERSSFDKAMTTLRSQYPRHINGEEPLFAFLDPFGVVGVSFDLVQEILHHERSELLLNFSTSGIVRLRGSKSDKNLAHVDQLFGTSDWRTQVSEGADAATRAAQAVNYYRERLMSVAGVRYAWAFGMGRSRVPDYYLVFASHHPLGLAKMKEAMRSLRQASGSEYSFFDAEAARAARDAASGQLLIFEAKDAKEDDPAPYATRLFETYKGQRLPWEDARDFAFNRTPLPSATKMLAELERRDVLTVELVPGVGPKDRKKFSFPPEKVAAVHLAPQATTPPEKMPDLFGD